MVATLQKSQPLLGLSNQKFIQFKLDGRRNKYRSLNNVTCILQLSQVSMGRLLLMPELIC